jgi:ATP-dependent phosphofructokinase / diphosphate-dependent phosphofructokinase
MGQQKILVAQGGGPTAVINQSMVGVVLEARNLGRSRRYTAPRTACGAS